MGFLTPKYPKSDTPGANGSGNAASRETRSERRDREARLDSYRRDASVARSFHQAEQDSEHRSSRFWGKK